MARAHKKHPMFVTERLRMRPLRSGDLEVLHALYSDADNLRYWSAPPYSRLEQSRRALSWHIAYRPRSYAIWAVEEKKSRRVVGMINYNRRDMREKRAELGWLALPAFQGKGFMTEAGRALLRHLFDDLACTRSRRRSIRRTSCRSHSPRAWAFARKAARCAIAGWSATAGTA